MEFGNEINFMNRTGYFSVLYHGDTISGKDIRTASQKLMWQGRMAVHQLIQLKMLTESQGSFFIQNILERVSARQETLNGGALALVFTCFDMNQKVMVMESWKKLVQMIDNGKKTDWIAYLDRYGITPESLARYYIYLKNFDLSID